MNNTIIEIKGLRKDYHVGEVTVHALRGVDLKIHEGEFVAIMGASGSGKSTMLNILGCLDKPTFGDYLLDGINVATMEKDAIARLRNQKLGFVFQAYNLLARTTALENVELPLFYNPKVRSKDRKEAALRALEAVGLSDRMHHMPNQLSGGQQQRVAIARSLVNNPVLILADEPTGNLDTRTSFEIMELFQDLNEKGRTIVYVTHETDIAKFATRNVMFRDGKISRENFVTDRLNAREILKTLPVEAIEDKLRAFLTMLGIIIGVASVIAMLAIGEGSKQKIRKQISSMGTNMVMVMPNFQRRGGVSLGSSSSMVLKYTDVTALRSEATAISAVSPEIRASGQVIYSNQNTQTTIYGVSEEYLAIKKLEILSGRVFNANEIKNMSKVCILGQTVVENLFGAGADPVGLTIRIKNLPFLIIGVLKDKGESGMGQDQDDLIIAPYTTVQRRLAAIDYINGIYASALSEEKSPAAKAEVEDILRRTHKLKESAENDFRVMSQTELLQTVTSITDIMTYLLGAIAGISLLVGGIGIMNIMFVSVTERTREIGLRMSIGGRGKDIMKQFLAESIILSILGGVMGVIFGYLLARLAGSLMSSQAVVKTQSVVLAFIVCFVIGVFFGWYPARKAANLNPIDALRYE